MQDTLCLYDRMDNRKDSAIRATLLLLLPEDTVVRCLVSSWTLDKEVALVLPRLRHSPHHSQKRTAEVPIRVKVAPNLRCRGLGLRQTSLRSTRHVSFVLLWLSFILQVADTAEINCLAKM
jgi:hypothetical protein